MTNNKSIFPKFINAIEAGYQISVAGTVPTENGGMFYKYGWTSGTTSHEDGSWIMAVKLQIGGRPLGFLIRGAKPSKKAVAEYEIQVGTVGVISQTLRQSRPFRDAALREAYGCSLRTSDFSQIIAVIQSEIYGTPVNK